MKSEYEESEVMMNMWCGGQNENLEVTLESMDAKKWQPYMFIQLSSSLFLSIFIYFVHKII